jgi:2Fe-2S ferredoxin
MVGIVFVEADGEEIIVDAAVGEPLMRAARNGGVAGVVAQCDGSMACGTCQVYLEVDWYKRLGGPSEIESDLIEFSLSPRETSRLSCQVVVLPDMEGMRVDLPEAQL